MRDTIITTVNTAITYTGCFKKQKQIKNMLKETLSHSKNFSYIEDLAPLNTVT